MAPEAHGPIDDQSAAPRAVKSAWSSLRYRVFRFLWIATVVSNVGSGMYNTASGWLMTSLDAHPLIVSLVQVASSVPLFLFGLPAGALADMIDRRHFILTLEILTTIFSAVFALLVALHVVTPSVLLLFIFLVGILGALEAPAWQAIVPQLVPKQALPSATAVNSVGVNISRVIGPAIAGIVIPAFGIAAPFWLDAFSNAGVIAVILWWRPPAKATHALPAERLLSAIRTGLRYAHNNAHLRATLVQAAGFFFFASAYWALLPVLARTQLHGGPILYGVLLGAIGAGAIAGAFLLPRLKARVGANGMVVVGGLGTAVALLLFGLAQQPFTAVLAALIAGLSWIAVIATLNVSAQLALPEWVRGRGLAVYVTVFFGTMSIGSVVWGLIADRIGLPPAHFIAGAGALLAIWLTRGSQLQTGPEADLTPSMHWPNPVLAGTVQDDAGPVLITVEYHVAAEQRTAFLAALARVARERKRDGAYAWGIYEDTAHAGRVLETFLVDSWLEHLRQHQRVTNADRVVEDHVRKLVRDEPRITHYIATLPTPAK